MPDNSPEFAFFSPVLAEGMIETCGKCNACRHACPVHAISVDTAGAAVDREACARNVLKNNGECFDCLLACKYVVLSLRRFKRRADGSIQSI
jgi:heterodisulfide reductase subunit A-like polyferredoxin